jgi:hypothetical protein
VGAHDLASGDGAAALSAFGKARAFSKEAKDEEGELMAAGYAAIARLLTKEEGAEQELRTAVEALRARDTDDAKFYADQIVMAQRMLAAWWKAHHLR